MKSGKNIIGRAEKITFIQFGGKTLPARIDTGAKTSAVWASNIKEKDSKLSFCLLGKKSPHFDGVTISTSDYSKINISSSIGHIEERYVVPLSIQLNGRRISARFTLADRSKQVYPVLVGRNILQGKFVVDVRAGAVLREEERIRSEEIQNAKIKPTTGRSLRIVILSKGPANYSTKRLREEAHLHGHHVRVVNYAACYLAVEKGKPVVYYKGSALTDVDVIVPRIAQSYTKYGTAVVRQFEMQGVYSTASSIAINRVRDKLRSYQLLSKTDVGIPKTVFARETADFEDVIEHAGGPPLIIKVARGTHGNGVVLAETKKAAQAVMQAFYVEGVNFLVQEFIKESAGNDIRAFVVGGKVVASMKRQSLDDDFRSNLHQGGQGSPVKLTDVERKTAQKAAKAMGLPICGVDMMRSDRGPLILEVNASPGLNIEKVTGNNVAGKIVEYVEQNAKGKRRRDRVGA
jgi:ribosomal protein S6--L-glutamate ligase